MHSSELAEALGITLALPAEIVLSDGRFCAVRAPTWLDVIGGAQDEKVRAADMQFLEAAGVKDAAQIYFLAERVVMIDDKPLTLMALFQLETYDVARIIAHVMHGLDRNIPRKK